MNSNQQILQDIYEAFNKRELEAIFSRMHPDVKWANGMEGGFVQGRDAVRAYWDGLFKEIQPRLEPLTYEKDEAGRDVVTVRQTVKNLQGDTLAEMTVLQIFTIENDLISVYEIGETETIQEAIQREQSA